MTNRFMAGAASAFAHLSPFASRGGRVDDDQDEDRKDSRRSRADDDDKDDDKESKRSRAEEDDDQDEDRKDSRSSRADDDDKDDDKESKRSRAEEDDDQDEDRKDSRRGRKSRADEDEDEDDDEKEASGSSASARAWRRSQARCAAIFATPATAHNPELAAVLAFDTTMPRSKAIARLNREAADGRRRNIYGSTRANPNLGGGDAPQDRSKATASLWDNAHAKVVGARPKGSLWDGAHEKVLKR